MPNIFIGDDIDTSLLCKKNLQYLENRVNIKNNSSSRIFDFKALNDNELDDGSIKKEILDKLIEHQEENAKELRRRAETSKNNLLKLIFGLSVLSVVALVLASVALFVPVVTAAMTALLAVGPWVFPLLIAVGISASMLLITSSFIFARKKYKNTCAHKESEDIVEQLQGKLTSLKATINTSLVGTTPITIDQNSSDADVQATPSNSTTPFFSQNEDDTFSRLAKQLPPEDLSTADSDFDKICMTSK